MLINFICMIFMMIFSLVSVAFLTLMERKILGYLQLRKGPNKLGFNGIFQPFSDAVKLFTKEYFFLSKVNFYPFWISPFISFFLSLLCWIIFPYNSMILSWQYSILFLFSVLSINIYPIMIAGWASNSSYSIIGYIRSIAQSISYEVSFFLIFLCMIILCLSLNFYSFIYMQKKVWFLFFTFPLFLIMFVSFLAELNRTPFDFSEGESELVSGFNIEYGGVGFSFIFLAEYLNILFVSVILTLLFLGGNLIFMKMSILSVFIILIRGVLPRYRYDKLMILCWKNYLMIILNLLMFYSLVLYTNL
uniref:NADH-ubiquinone oxidoreductase chain 1 n=1 Tax=Paurocephala sauteri TaxID=2768670 RepID=A0A7L9R572_9HEMI|nr:NADH dehydrogenase subunit 1 [Paurocephala sauteri]QOL10539.1 NADH dehydrogenase subunit 1 [Paurocephala sauteri]